MTNNQDKIEELPTIEELERQKIQAEIQKLKKPLYKESAFYSVIAPSILALFILIITGVYSGWFNVRQERLKNEKILIEAQTKDSKTRKNQLKMRLKIWKKVQE